jgi:hypothetical protein
MIYVLCSGHEPGGLVDDEIAIVKADTLGEARELASLDTEDNIWVFAKQYPPSDYDDALNFAFYRAENRGQIASLIKAFGFNDNEAVIDSVWDLSDR